MGFDAEVGAKPARHTCPSNGLGVPVMEWRICGWEWAHGNPWAHAGIGFVWLLCPDAHCLGAGGAGEVQLEAWTNFARSSNTLVEYTRVLSLSDPLYCCKARTGLFPNLRMYSPMILVPKRMLSVMLRMWP